ncbi:MAG: TonB-dependent receptor, partial [Chitinophagaceae bacterium]
MKPLFLLISFFVTQIVFSQNPGGTGIIAGNVLDEATGKALASATVTLFLTGDSAKSSMSFLADKDGDFSFTDLAMGLYSISISSVGYAVLRIDSIHIRAERIDFNLPDIKLTAPGKELSGVIIYAEKPLIENKDGKITFNVGESALSGGSSTTELLKQTPLVSVDNDGKVLMKGKEVKILIDDKPVEMDARQLQDLLESMPGSMIEKIEVLTTPPPQYANERGGVINIVTKKGKVGMSGRLNINYGTRGELGTNGNFSYRKNKLAVNFSAGISHNEYNSRNYSKRVNNYADSSNYFNTVGTGMSNNLRPTSRLNIDYELNKKNALSFTAFFNANNTEGESGTEYSNLNRYEELYRLSQRQINSEGSNRNPSISSSYTHKGKTPGEVLRIIAAAAYT